MTRHSAFILTLLLCFVTVWAAELKFIPDWTGMELPSGVVEKENALSFASKGRVVFKDPAIHTETGSISMDFQLNYDPSDGALIKENPAWRNQTLFTIERKDIFAQGYMTINGGRTSICFGVFQRGKPALFVTSAKFQFEKGKTYRVAFAFGKEVLIHIDGRQVVAQPKSWRGLFGEAAPASIASFSLGASQIGGIANNCSIGNVQVVSRNLSNERISVPKLARPPQATSFEDISNILKDHGVAICGFCNAGRLLEKKQAKLALAYSDEGIYFTAHIPTADGAAPRAMETKHDGAVWRDDALEIRIQPKSKGPVHVFIGNAACTCMDGIQPPGNIKNADWMPNPPWHFSARKSEDAWQAAGFIPFSSLDCKDVPSPGSTWKASFSIGRPSGVGATLSQSNASCYPDPDGFPELLFTGTVQALGLEDIGDFALGRPRLAFHVTQSRDPVVSIQARLHDAAGREMDSWQFRLNDQLDAVYMPPELPEGDFSMVVNGSNSLGTELFRRVFSFRTEKKSSLKIRNYPYHRYAEVHLTANTKLKENASIMARISLNKDEKTLATKRIELEKTLENAVVRFDTGTLEAGEYTVKADLETNGQLVETVSGILKIFPKPAWFDNAIAIDHSVPPPWKEIETIPNGNRVLLREYMFNNKVMFQQIINQQTKMLRKPPVFKLKLANAKEIDLSLLPVASTEQHPDKVIRRGTCMSGNARITLEGILEFDGCMRYDLRIEPPEGGLLVENLLLSMELEPFWGNMVVAGTGTNHAVEKINGVRKYPFRPYNFLGGDNGGIAVFVESEENWTQGINDAICLEASPQKGSSMTLHIVSGKDIKLTRPFTYTIGAIATPVRKHNGNPTYLTHWSRSRNEQIVFAENISYPPLPALPQGMLELMLRKTEDGASPGPIVAMEISGKDISLRNDNGTWIFSYGGKPLAKAPGHICGDRFGCLRLSWGDTGYQASFEGNELFKDIQLPRPEKAGTILTLGMKDAWKTNEKTSIMIDALRLAKEASAKTSVLQDEYDEDFVPDGFSTLTFGGGLPSPGARFVPSPSGKALLLKTSPPISELQFRKQLGVKHERIWRWHNDGPGIERQWPPNYFNSPLQSTLQRVKKAHQDGFLAIPYAIYPAIHYPSQLAEQFGAEWETIPVNMIPYPPPAGHQMYRVSLAAKGYADYLLAGLEDAFDKYQFDGIYTDGMLSVFANSNAAAGCGWSDAQGRRHPTWPFFAVRENVKRIYKLVKSKPGRIVENHQSFSLPAMLIGFSDKLFTGELEDFSDLDTARMRFSARPWGVNLQLHRTEEWLPLNVMTGLLVGTQVDGRALGGKHDLARKFMRIRQAMETFGTEKAKFLPFHIAEPSIIEAMPHNVHCAAWMKNDGALLVIANYGNAPVNAEIKLKKGFLGSAGLSTKASSALTGAKYRYSAETLQVPLLPRNFQMVLIQ